MPYQTPTLSQLIQQGEQQFNHRLPNLKRNNVVTVINRVCAALSAGEHVHLDYLAKQIIPTTADENYLIEYALYKGIARKPASKAEGLITLDVAVQAEIPEGTAFQHQQTGLKFFTLETQTATVGKFDVKVQCDTEGSIGNLSANTPVALTSSILGVKPNAVIKLMSGGADIESLSRLLSRLIQRVQFPPAGGAPHDYIRWANEVPGITRAWCYPRYKGGGTTGVAIVCDDRSDILPTSDDIQKVKKHIEGHKNTVTGLWEGMPAGNELFVFAPTVKTQTFTIRLVPASTQLKSAVQNALISYFKTVEPEQKIYISHLRAIVSNVIGEVDNSIISPNEDIQLARGEIIKLGEITWQA
ncbi:TPA: baseplate J/gp47 family protein [Pasteurella multocida]|nr:baseplate J/gp47 family protein [Pasteurella multocida]